MLNDEFNDAMNIYSLPQTSKLRNTQNEKKRIKKKTKKNIEIKGALTKMCEKEYIVGRCL